MRALARVGRAQANIEKPQARTVQTAQTVQIKIRAATLIQPAALNVFSLPALETYGSEKLTLSPRSLCQPATRGADPRKRTRTWIFTTDGVPHGRVRRVRFAPHSYKDMDLARFGNEDDRAHTFSDCGAARLARELSGRKHEGKCRTKNGNSARAPETAFAGDLSVSGYLGAAPSSTDRTARREGAMLSLTSGWSDPLKQVF
jgi:hypothetical protein